MLDLSKRLTTSYNAEPKIWSGASEPSSYSNDLTIGEIIFEQLQKDPERICQISHSEKTTLTRSQLLENASKVGAYLRQEGFIEETDMVAILARNTTHVASLAFGCMFNGTPFHGVHPDVIESIICHSFNITKPRIIFCGAQDYDKLKHVADKMNNEIKQFETKMVIIDGIVEGVTNILDIFKNQLQPDYKPERFKNGIDRMLAIINSSGTTGMPKAVTISNSRKIFEFYRYLSENDIQYSPSSLDWVSGIMVLTSAAVYGTLRVITKEAFGVTSFLTLCEEYKITWTLMSALHITMIANSPEVNAKQLRTLRYILFGGDRSLIETLEKLQAYLQYEGILHQLYGMTELGCGSTCNLGPKSKLTSVGLIQPNIRMRIVSESGEALGPNEYGELHCHLGQHWGGYYDNIAATREIQDSDGWVYTGDVGYFDDDNYLYIVGRKNDFLKFMSKIYYPREIEEVIARMPEVAEVCVFGIWNEIDGDAAAASVVTKAGCQLTANQVLEFVAGNISENYKQLHAGVQIVPNLAKNLNGKVNRQAVKEEFLKATRQI
ncbi:probable 4-coumarate--CoA ligase 1 [Drosophila albomicans]|uniref:Probable 4-coumarate--CoA ligase 1 n=1 Tax=Drosophila albomicans TaxID=7291 RepID=A0A9C6WHP9_DROAB|nr:probable 4-coumarate--CoA ligase 1 [Drosophila albomicans]